MAGRLAPWQVEHFALPDIMLTRNMERGDPHAFVNVVVSTFSALEVGAGASRSRAQKMFPTTRQFDTLMLSRCAVLRVVVNFLVLEAGVCVCVCTPKTRARNTS